MAYLKYRVSDTTHRIVLGTLYQSSKSRISMCLFGETSAFYFPECL